MSKETIARKLEPIHPGEILLEDFIKPAGITMNQLALALQVPNNRINQICAGDRSITGDTAHRLARYWGTTAEFWMNLQSHYDLQRALDEHAKQIEQVRPRQEAEA